MSLKDRLLEEIKAAMREKAEARLGALRLLKAAIQRREVDERIQLDDSQFITVAEKLIKQGREAVEQFEKAGRAALAAKEKAEMALWQTFLPAAMSDAEVDALIAAAITESGATNIKDMGKVMAAVKPKVQGRADMGTVSTRIKALLGT